MSADLFAEFGSFSPSAPPTAQPTAQPSSAADPFSFLASAPAPAPAHAPAPARSQPPSQLQPWPSFPTQSSSSSTTFDDSSWASLTRPVTATAQANGDDDDTWGDFEVASPVREEAPAPAPPPAPRASYAKPAPAVSTQSPVRTRIVRASTLDLMTNNLLDLGGMSPASSLAPVHEAPVWSKQAKTPAPKPKNTDPNVLFDADDFDPNDVATSADDDDDDDFGEFETIAPPVKAPTTVPTPAPSQPPSMDIFSLDWSTPTPAALSATGMSAASGARKEPPSQLLATLSLSDGSNYPSPPKSPSFQERNPFPGLAVTTPRASEFAPDAQEPTTSPVTAWPSLAQQSADVTKAANSAGAWGAFQDFPAETRGSAAQEAPGWDWDAVDAAPEPQPRPGRDTAPQEPPSDWSWGDADSPTTHVPAPAPTSAAPPTLPDDAPPPTNIPPPSVLLSLFPSLLALPATALLKPAAAGPPALKARVLADPAAAAFLRGYLALAVVAARILAGRRLRWTRDRFLAQGMAISAAPAAGVKAGLKLAGVDRAQVARDEREAADVLAAWKAHLGPLRAAVAAANAAPATHPPLRVPKLAQDAVVEVDKMAIKAPRPCVVCGLRRQERLEGVDVDVEDSFGEWWVEHWGHRACRNFWAEHEKSLRSR